MIESVRVVNPEHGLEVTEEIPLRAFLRADDSEEMDVGKGERACLFTAFDRISSNVGSIDDAIRHAVADYEEEILCARFRNLRYIV